MDKENVVHTYNVILLRLKKEGNPAIHNDMHEPESRYAKWNKPITNGQILHDSTYTKYLKWSDS